MMNAHISRYKNFALVMMCFISVDSCAIDQERIKEYVIGALLAAIVVYPVRYVFNQPSERDLAMAQARATTAQCNLESKRLETVFQTMRLQEEIKKREAEAAKNQQASEQKRDEITLSKEDKKTEQLININNILHNQIRKNETTYLVRNQTRELIEWHQQKFDRCREEESEDHPRCREFERNLNTEIGLARYYEEELMKETQQSKSITFENNRIVINL